MIRHLDASAVLLGAAAVDNRSLPREWFESTAAFDDEAIVDAAMWETNAARREARRR